MHEEFIILHSAWFTGQGQECFPRSCIQLWVDDTQNCPNQGRCIRHGFQPIPTDDIGHGMFKRLGHL